MVPPEVGSSQIKCQELASFLASGKVTNIGRKAFHRRSAVQPLLQTLDLWVKIEGVYSCNLLIFSYFSIDGLMGPYILSFCIPFHAGHCYSPFAKPLLDGQLHPLFHTMDVVVVHHQVPVPDHN